MKNLVSLVEDLIVSLAITGALILFFPVLNSGWGIAIFVVLFIFFRARAEQYEMGMKSKQ